MPGFVAAALRKPIEVRIVDGESEWLHIALASAGPLFVALAAIVAAVVAARTANRRQQQQLDHDFALRRHEYVRNTLDSAVELAQEAIRADTALAIAASEVERERPGLLAILKDGEASESYKEVSREKLQELVQAGFKKWNTASDLVLEMHLADLRLSLRLGVEHEISTRYVDLREAINSSVNSALAGIKKSRTKQQLTESKAKDDELGKVFGAFMARCQQWLAQKPEPDTD